MVIIEIDILFVNILMEKELSYILAPLQKKQRRYIISKTFDWTKPATTRAGSSVKIYEMFYGRYANGAYYDSSTDVYYPCQWDMSGVYGSRKSPLDLVNVKEFPVDE